MYTRVRGISERKQIFVVENVYEISHGSQRRYETETISNGIPETGRDPRPRRVSFSYAVRRFSRVLPFFFRLFGRVFVVFTRSSTRGNAERTIQRVTVIISLLSIVYKYVYVYYYIEPIETTFRRCFIIYTRI